MNKVIRKQIGKPRNANPLHRVFELNEFLKSLGRVPNYEPNIEPIRKTVGRPRKVGR